MFIKSLDNDVLVNTDYVRTIIAKGSSGLVDVFADLEGYDECILLAYHVTRREGRRIIGRIEKAMNSGNVNILKAHKNENIEDII